MGYFNHGWWEAVRAALELQPLDSSEKRILADTLERGACVDEALFRQRDAVARLVHLDLVEIDLGDGGWFEWSDPEELLLDLVGNSDAEILATDLLVEANARGLVASVLEAC